MCRCEQNKKNVNSWPFFLILCTFVRQRGLESEVNRGQSSLNAMMLLTFECIFLNTHSDPHNYYSTITEKK